MMLGTHVTKSWNTNQVVIALSSGEAEYYGMVKGASQPIGPRGLADDLGVTYKGPIQINTDASAALGIGSRLGIGKVTHIEVNQLSLQDKVFVGEIARNKLGSTESNADALKKPVNAETLQHHVDHSGGERRRDRHRIAPEIAEGEADKGVHKDSLEQGQLLKSARLRNREHIEMVYHR